MAIGYIATLSHPLNVNPQSCMVFCDDQEYDSKNWRKEIAKKKPWQISPTDRAPPRRIKVGTNVPSSMHGLELKPAFAELKKTQGG